MDARGLQLTPIDQIANLPVANSSYVLELSSNPGASRTIYLDFDGHVQRSWTRSDVTRQQTFLNIVSASFDTDDKAGFSVVEQAQIREIWSRVAEDFAPFDVNVTTVLPSAIKTNDRRVVIGGSDFVTGTQRSGYSSSLSNVVYVFSQEIIPMTHDNEGTAANLSASIATTASHEVGHTFGLDHAETYNAAGTKTADYSVGDAQWTPIMGNNLSVDKTAWSTNAVVGAETYPWSSKVQYIHQNQLEILGSTLGSRTDEAGDTSKTARNFPTIKVASTYKYGEFKGIISTPSDVDWFRFDTTGGTNSISIQTNEAGPNLEVNMQIWKATYVYLGIRNYREVLVPVANNVCNYFGLSTSLSAGTYYVSIQGNNTAAIEGLYANVGQYTLAISAASSQATPPVVFDAKQSSLAQRSIDMPIDKSAFDVANSIQSPAVSAENLKNAAIPTSANRIAESAKSLPKSSSLSTKVTDNFFASDFSLI